MAKMRVHELAKELGKQNKEIMEILNQKGVGVTSHMSALEDKQIEIVKKTVTGEEKPNMENRPSETPKNNEGEAPKKKNISQVFHPQNSRTGMGRPGQRGPRPGQRSQNGERRPAQGGERSGAASASQDERRPQGQGGERRPASGERRPQGQGGERRPASGERRVQGQGGERRPASGERRPQGQGGERRPASGERRPQGQSGERRPSSGERRPQGQGGERRPASGERRVQGQGGERRGQGGDRRGNQRGGQSIPKPPMESQPLTKETRNRNERSDKNRNNRKEDKFERLEKNVTRNNTNNKNQKNQKGGKPQPKAAPVQEKKEDEIKNITLPETMTIRELADKMKVQAAAIVKKLFMQGKIVTVNHEIDYETAEEIALEFNCIAEPEEKVDVIGELLKEEEEDESTMVPRPPVVCVMGHVDHGKTSLLDAIRHTHVIAKEAGGITQHIGAYMVDVKGQKITFLDTPGHEAFTAMRMRGANSTDIAILVVAADDGVMPQTIEAINHAKAAGIEIIVAINKIDKPSANIERVKQELSEYGLIPEDWGGSTIFVPVSAHTHEGIEELLEMILLTAEVAELKANPNRNARGLVIEAQLDKGKGPVATVLVQKGTLHVGDPIAAGSCYGKVRAMIDDKGRRVKEAGPSVPVEILGLSDVPNAGEIFVQTNNEKEARSFAETFIKENREKLLEETKSKMSLDDLFNQIQAGNLKELNIIVKADVQGSVEAVKQSLLKLSNDEVVVKIIHGGVGAINESDVTLAATSNAIVIGFNVRPDATAKATAEREGVDVRLYRVIYDAIADVESAMKGMLDPIYEEKVIGHAEVRQLFKASGVGTIAGSYVLDGTFQRNCKVRISREGTQIYEGALASLKRFKDDVKEVKAGYECGLVFEKFNDIQEFDQVEAYIMVEVPR
ncbi:MAG TPA: translation initiation factor IF-2 [Candidatus Limivivens merdigallinarum]|uniref:Translation initiation factor IF-2 n=1 Tax=Candidatus Limivivens merdigallinarum TaxID=2840859 RepID=A0A9D0ZX79_9FIRM|nr:translation initiation factor IF-2 [Candidatus Limivivens merdigallinarum]